MKIIVFKDGNTRKITGEQGKYWLTGENRVRKLSDSIAVVREIPDPVEVTVSASAPADMGASVVTGAAKKKSTKKKKTEDNADGERGK